MISTAQLRTAIEQRITTYNKNDFPLSNREVITCALLDSRNHVLAQRVTAPFAIPRQNISAMDGYAIAHHSDVSKDSCITIIGESQAGRPYLGEIKAGQGVRIFTGAVVPSHCDTVVMQENTNFAEIKSSLDKSQPYQIILSKTADVDANIRKQGEEIQQAEDVLSQGKRINPSDISLLANLGISHLQVFKPLTVGLLATGDELVALGGELQHLAQIYNSNTPTLKSLLAPLPIKINDYGIIPDNLEQTITCVNEAMQACDVLISTAGVSVGDYDFLTTVIESLGQINHYKVAMKPGKPFVFGELCQAGDKPVLFFGLPGNPLATVVGALQFVIPALWQMSGVSPSEQPMQLTVKAVAKNDIRKSPGRMDFQRGILSQAESGTYEVECFSKQDSHRIKQLSLANCFIVLDQDSASVASGTIVNVQPFPWLHI